MLPFLEKKLNLYGKEIHYLMPEIISFNEEGTNTIHKFLEQYNVSPDLNTNISKNDIMFKYLLYNHNSVNEAIYHYLQTGFNSLNVIEKLVNQKTRGFDKINSFLDFASGYGRVTRFLITKIAPEKISVSEIKEQAVRFQKEQFGVNGFLSSFIPEKFNPDRKFDFIFVGSFFSHVPHDVFERWLKILYDLLSDKGILAITVHDISLINHWACTEYKFHCNNEDLMFKEVDNYIDDGNKYGTTYVRESYMLKVFKNIGIHNNQYCRYKKASRKVQDIYVITKDKTVFDDTLDFYDG